MKETLTEGVSAEVKQRVVSQHLVSYQDSRLVPVLASPWMLSFMEHAAYNAIQPHLDDGEQSVGVGFQFEHLAATPAGNTVTASARITAVEDRRITLAIEAHDDQQLIGKGTHVRAVIDMERFKKKLNR